MSFVGKMVEFSQCVSEKKLLLLLIFCCFLDLKALIGLRGDCSLTLPVVGNLEFSCLFVCFYLCSLEIITMLGSTFMVIMAVKFIILLLRIWCKVRLLFLVQEMDFYPRYVIYLAML